MENTKNRTYKKEFLALESGIYEIKIIQYFVLKAYNMQSDFIFSSGESKKTDLDDVFLEGESGKVFVQVKYKSSKRQISNRAIFNSTGDFSLNAHLKTYYKKIFLPFLDEVDLIITKMMPHCNSSYNNLIERALGALSKIKDNRELKDCFNNLLEILPMLNDTHIDNLLMFFRNTLVFMVINVKPQVGNFEETSVNSDFYFENDGTCYRFNTITSVKLLQRVLDKSISEDFIEIFLSKFFWFTISPKILEKNIFDQIEQIREEFAIDSTYKFNRHLFDILKNWRIEPTGTFITRNRMKYEFLTGVENAIFIEELRSNRETLSNDIRTNIGNEKITLIQTHNCELFMKTLEKQMYEEDFDKVVFLDPIRTPIMRQKVLSAFLHNDSTHLICLSGEDDCEIQNEIIDSEEFMKNEKKIILIFQNKFETESIFGMTKPFLGLEVICNCARVEKRKVKINKMCSSLYAILLKKLILQTPKLFEIENCIHSYELAIFDNINTPRKR